MSVRAVDKVLKGLPLDDRIGALIVNLCENRVDAIMAIGGLAVTAGIIAKNIKDKGDRRRCAMYLRDIAGDVESSEHQPLKARG